MYRIKTDTCKRCGSVKVKWVKSKRTGRYYLALAFAGTTREDGQVYPQTPHQCDSPNRGGFEPCPRCGKPHVLPMNLNPTAEDCARYA